MKSDTDFIVLELKRLQYGVCPACLNKLPSIEKRLYSLTCDKTCHDKWLDSLVAKFGEIRHVTSSRTGKVHLVPTRLILEEGLKGDELDRFPVFVPG